MGAMLGLGLDYRCEAQAQGIRQHLGLFVGYRAQLWVVAVHQTRLHGQVRVRVRVVRSLRVRVRVSTFVE